MVKKLCRMNGISLSQLEREVGLSNGQLGKLKKSSPSVNKVSVLADYFDVSIDYLVGRKRHENVDDKFKMNISDDMFEVIGKMQIMTKEQQKQVRDIVNVLDRK
ncbi:helix-turn-helix domain-containing protein [Staphylococcus equorum]|uniref:helix-turn-helix domain-containing protein n=1 Tax=Staphylococcus equorum TaxID=246432 RepID=UPI0023529EF7|nr:helix-turn-helix transcriptional regulator [Staphylococcus equorum]